jgi:transcription-repair coupling factor (superfamily II helicase)
MKKLLKLIQKNEKHQQIVNDLLSGKDCHIQGLWGSSAAYLIAGLASNRTLSSRREILFITPTIEEAEEVLEDINTFLSGNAILFPASEDAFLAESKFDNQAYVQQLSILHKLLSDNKSSKTTARIIIVPIQALLQQIPRPEMIEQNILVIKIGQEYKQEFILNWLIEGNFERTSMVELPGEFSLRGGIIDIFPHSSDMPYRIEFFGDEVVSIRMFDAETQMSENEVSECQILGVQTSTKSVSNGVISTLINYMPEGSWIVFKEFEKIENKAKSIINNLKFSTEVISFNHILKSCRDFTKIYLSSLMFACLPRNGAGTAHRQEHKNAYSFDIKSSDQFDNDVNNSIKKVEETSLLYDRTIIFCNNRAEEQRLCELLSGANFQHESNGKQAPSNHMGFHIGHLNHGFMFEDISAAFLTHHEIFRRYQIRREPKKRLLCARAIDSFLDLEKGDYVVHTSHGIAKFLGMQMLNDDDGIVSQGEFLMLEFAEGAKVYVPVTKIELVQKYICGSDRKPKLSKIGKRTWERKKQKVEEAVRDVASGLLSMQAIRGAKQGIVYPKDTEWQRKFESEFIYQETEDQLQVVEEIKKDMRSSKPMDRLVCGDVGFGKTEIAIRAAFKAVMYGKQVAVLVPTTILAQQHYRTFSERMKDYPINVDVLSRFKTRSEQKEVLKRLHEGKTDIVIGTHRLVQKDVIFKDIGLVVIDEEQRFGVEHKEKLKKLRETVDVLTLTATPIPRTLHMSLLGIKDISSLNIPPQERQSIRTRLLRFDPEIIRSAIIFELNRDGQVYFVHNRVKDINRIANIITKIVPEARITVAHGQMPERTLEKKMTDFVGGKSDILVSTTIIESGLDIPNVNTIFINHSDTFGLADLHQLRGRVGRYKHLAYAYLLLPKDRPITPEAEKRLKAIVDFSELGAGFKIAMRDLEIRGAGNIVGIEQHGHIEAVGYEMFCRLLEIAIRKARNEPVSVKEVVNIDLNLESYLPDDYVPDTKLKMEIYRKINRISSNSEVKEIEKELIDRFGQMPHQVKNLLVESEVRIAAQASNIRSLVRVNGSIIIQIESLKKAESLFRNAKKLVRVVDNDEVHLVLPKKRMSPEESVDFLKNLLISNSNS